MGGRKTLLIGVLVLVALIVSVVSVSTSVPRSRGEYVYYAVDTSLLGSILYNMGIDYELRHTSTTGSPYFAIKYHNITLKITFYDWSESLDGYVSLMFYAAWRAYGSVSITDVNQWNAAMRGGRAYLDGDQDPVVEQDYLIEGGITWQNIENVILRFCNYAELFQEYIS